MNETDNRDITSLAGSCEALVVRSRDGDPQALATLYRRFAPMLLEYLERFLGERAEAEDVLQETFLRVFLGRGRYKERGRFRAWLFTVATRLAQDRLKQQRRRRELAAREYLTRECPDPGQELLHRQLLAQVESALADLPASHTQAFHLRVREGFTYRQIASICGESEGTLRSRVYHTLKRIRLVLDREGFRSPAERTRKED